MENTISNKKKDSASNQENSGNKYATNIAKSHFEIMQGLVRDAEMDLIKEKIKSKLNMLQEEKYSNLAQILIDSVFEKRKGKNASLKIRDDLKEEFKKVLMKNTKNS